MNGTLSATSLRLDTCNAQTISLDNQTHQTTNASTSPQADVGATCSDPANLTATTAGIAVPLGVLTLASLIALVVQIRHNRSLKRTLQRGVPSENLPMSQATSLEDRPQGKGLAQGQQRAHSYPAMNELFNHYTPIESGGRPVVVELPTRFIEPLYDTTLIPAIPFPTRVMKVLEVLKQTVFSSEGQTNSLVLFSLEGIGDQRLNINTTTHNL
jgi:hypothetical protein